MPGSPTQKSGGIRGFTVRENLNMSPIEKHIQYNKFSYRLIYNIILVTLVTSQVLFIFDNDADYSRQEQRTFRNLFMDGTNDDDHEPVYSFTTPGDLQTHLMKAEKQLTNLNDYMFQKVSVENATLMIQVQHHFGLPEIYQGPLSDGFKNISFFDVNDINSLKNFLEDTVEMEVVASGVRVFNQKMAQNPKFCQDWEINLDYDAKSLSRVDLTVSSRSSLCGIDNADVESTHIAMSFLVIVFGALSLILSVQKLKSISMMFLRLKAGYNNYAYAGMSRSKDENPLLDKQDQDFEEEEEVESPQARQRLKTYLKYNSWEDIPIRAKLKLLSPWFFFNTLGNIFQLISSISIILTYYLPGSPQSFYNANITLGFSVFFSWAVILQYLTYWKDVTLITTTLSKTGSNSIVYFGIVFPIFIGCCILAYSLFWKYNKFNTLSRTSRTLFSMCGGDIVHETFLDTWDEGIVCTIFFISFMVLFYTAFINIFVAVIMEGYDKGKLMKQIDNDDTFKTQDNILKDSKDGDLFGLDDASEELLQGTNSGYNLKDKIEKKIAVQLELPVRNVMNTLLNQQEQAKVKIAQLLRIRRGLLKSKHDETSMAFVLDIISNSFNRILNQIFYIRSGLKSKPMKHNVN